MSNNLTTGLCWCMGPQDREPLCPCNMRKARAYLDKPSIPETLKDAVIHAVRVYVEHPGVKGWNGKSLKEALQELDKFDGQ